MTLHRAVLTNTDYLPDGEEHQWFASIDGERWLPVNQQPLAEHEADVAALFDGSERADGTHFNYITFGTRYLHHMGALILNENDNCLHGGYHAPGTCPEAVG